MDMTLTTFWLVTAGAYVVLYLLGHLLKLPLWIRVLIALVAGGVVGYIFGDVAGTAKPIGDGFIKLIRMLIIPLVFTTIVAGVIAMGDPKRIGGLGAKTIFLYMLTTVVAVSIGIASAHFFQPGVGVDTSNVDLAAQSSVVERLERAAEAKKGPVAQILDIIPANPLKAMVEGDVLAVIFFSIILGVAIIVSGQGNAPLGHVMESAAEAVIKLTGFVMSLAPYGVFALMAWVLGTQGLAVLENLAKLTLALYVACVIHIILVYGGLIRFVCNLPFIKFLGGILDAMTTAYSTASSSATLPVTINNVTKNLGVERSVAGSVLPLGATINMDGTSIYLGIVALFAAQAVGIPLDVPVYIAIAVTATALSIGTASVPSASLFLAVSLLDDVVGVPTETAILIVALIFPFDRLLDMMRTMTNVTGDAAVAVTVATWEGDIDKDVFRGQKSTS